MPYQLTQHTDYAELQLSEEVTIQEASALHADLLQSLESEKPLRLNLDTFKRMDAAILQILLAAKKIFPQFDLHSDMDAWSKVLKRFGIEYSHLA